MTDKTSVEGGAPRAHRSGAVWALAANLAGNGWAAVLGLLMVPVYLRLVGVEAYGLMGFFTSLTTMLQIFDFGLSPTINRELARYTVQPDKAVEARDLVRSLEMGYWAVAVLLGLGVAAIAPWIATDWLQSTTLSVDVLRASLLTMAVVVLLQWPISLYQSGLIGLHQQGRYNALWIAFTTLRHLGSLAVLTLHPSIVTYFVWQAITSALYVTALALSLWRCLPAAERAPRFDRTRLLSVWRFAAGVSAMTVTALILTQFDKIVLSTLLDLSHFGYYTLATTVAGSLGMLVGPVFNVVFPRFAALVQLGQQRDLNHSYHRAAQVIAVLVVPAAAVLFFFSEPLILIWTGDALVAANVAQISRWLAIGSALNALMTAATALQLAYGWTRLSITMNVVLIAVFLPLTVLIGPIFGGIGVAGLWIALNVIYMVVSIPLTHHRLIGGEFWQWVFNDVGPVVIVSGLVSGLGAYGVAQVQAGPAQLVAIAAIGIVALGLSIAAAPQVRRMLRRDLLARAWQ